MFPRSGGPTCLSSDSHDDNISNYLLHYLGCIELTERDTFFDKTNPVWEKEIQHRLRRSNLEHDEAIRDQVHREREKWQRECQRYLRRVALIRKCIAEESSNLVKSVSDSLNAWRNTTEYKEGIEDVKRWSNRPYYKHPDPETPRDESYDPDKDLNVHIIRYKDREDSTMEVSVDERGYKSADISHEDIWKERMETETMKVHEIVSKAENGEHHRLNQLRDGTTREAISYVHFPANNMKWVEEAIARYYDQDAPDYQGGLRSLHYSEKTESCMILQPQYWRGLMHGSTSSLPHTRHMRLVCETISSDPKSVSVNPKNMVLFMPYLHWEKDRCRHKFTTAMQKIRETWEADRLEQEIKRKEEHQRMRSGLYPNIVKLRPSFLEAKRDALRLARLPEVVERKYPRRVVLPQGYSRPGQFLLDAAALCEAISHFRDEQLLKEYLYMDPPLHPRRTLDQAYYWTGDITKDRDRDQVIYRATNAGPQEFRHWDHKCEEWVDHRGEKSKEECDSCTKAIKKVSRTLMVDQLWMWILEGKTIITCFPKRYGAQEHDPFGVHKSIRTRLEGARPNQVKSVFDVALIIIDECSKIFFDQAETADLQPRVMVKFSEAIGNIARKKTISSERLASWAKNATDCYGHFTSTYLNGRSLSIFAFTHEVNMYREINDIIEELDIMIDIVRSHTKVVGNFITQVQKMLDPELDPGESFGYRHMSRGYYPSRNPGQPLSPGGSSEDKKKHTYKIFMRNAEETRIKMDSRIMDLEQLRQSAQSVCDSATSIISYFRKG